MPTRAYMDFASRESEAHKDKVGKATYYSVDGSNRLLFELYNSFNRGIPNPKTFGNRNDALHWLITD